MPNDHTIAIWDDEWPEGIANPLDTEDELEEIPIEPEGDDERD